MKIKSIKINNYKSFSNYKNVLYTNNNITCIVGINESGKSNFIEALSKINFNKEFMTQLNSYKNNGSGSNSKIEIKIILEKDGKESTFIFNDEGNFFKGYFSDLLSKDHTIEKSYEYIKNIFDENKIPNLNNNNKNNYKNLLGKINNYNNHIIFDISNIKKPMKAIINTIKDKDKNASISVDSFFDKLNEYYSILPQFKFIDNNNILKSSYTKEDIEKIFFNKNDILYKLLDYSKISEEDIISLFKNFNKSDQYENSKKSIKNKIRKYFIPDFTNYFLNKNIEIIPSIEKGMLKILIEGEYFTSLEDRSEGFRWFLSLAIDTICDKNINKGNHIFYLFDEPDIHLHVNIKRKMLELFEELTKEKNQIIYTTHSPYMIDNSKLFRVVAFKKDNDENTNIYNKIHNQELSPKSKEDALSPIYKSIGADAKYNLNDFNKINIITEGVTDTIILKAIKNHLGIEKDINFIPSVGAQNITHISSILYGWGYDFCIILDFDKAGLKAKDNIQKNYGELLKENIVFINGKKGFEVNTIDKEQKMEIEDLIETSILGDFISEKSDKFLFAKEFSEKLSNGEISIDSNTENNFINLFKTLKLI